MKQQPNSTSQVLQVLLQNVHRPGQAHFKFQILANTSDHHSNFPRERDRSTSHGHSSDTVRPG